MQTRLLWQVFWVGVLLCGPVATTAHVRQVHGEEVLVAWEFNNDGDTQGWHGGRHLRDLVVSGGTLKATAVGADPILVHDGFAEPLSASPFQVIEIRLFSPIVGTAEFFWTNTLHTQYGGFSPGKETPFDVQPGWKVYRVRPFWQAEGKIIKLRFDLPPMSVGESRKFEIDYIRIIELAPPTGLAPLAGDRIDLAEGWQIEGTGSVRFAEGYLTAELSGQSALIAPPLKVEVDEKPFLHLVLASNRGTELEIQWATGKTHGEHSYALRIAGDGQFHGFNVPLGVDPNWQSSVVFLALRVKSPEPVQLWLKGVEFASEPQGAAEPEIRAIGLEDALPRVGRASRFVVTVGNRGGQPARHVAIELKVPDGVELVAESKPVQTIEWVDFYEPQSVSWELTSREPGPKSIAVVASWQEASLTHQIRSEITETFLPALNLPAASYVPEPKPVRGPYEVGVYYYPGWKDSSRWEPIRYFPERRPVLGWYAEGSPEVADWHIKWAVEHGITFFCYDWYWIQGSRHHEHAIHEGFFHARYRSLIKFCLLWANHFGRGEHSPADNERVCRYWIEEYFRRPEYFKVEGRPVVVIFSVYSMERDLGIEGTRQAIELWHKLTREAGVGEVLVAGCGRPEMLAKMKEMGFDAVTGYNWPYCGVAGRNWVPYIEVARNQFAYWWMPMAEAGLMPVFVPTSPGWDARPWHGDKAFVQLDRTPEAFEEHLRWAKRFIDETKQPKVVFIEAWNEWGEGSYCEPHKEFGFGHLEAIRRVFCPDAAEHVDFGPQDVGLPLREAPTPKFAAEWTFDEPGNLEGWSTSGAIASAEVERGLLRLRSRTDDPALTTVVSFRAERYPAIEIRMAARGPRPQDLLQLFWSTAFARMTEKTSLRIPLLADGQMRIYRLETKNHPFWRGVIRSLRLDPCSAKDVVVEIDWIRLVPAETESAAPLRGNSYSQTASKKEGTGGEGANGSGEAAGVTESRSQRIHPESGQRIRTENRPTELRQQAVGDHQQAAGDNQQKAERADDLAHQLQKHESYRQEILQRMQQVMGPLPGPERKVALDVETLEEVALAKYVLRKITYATEPGDRVPAYLLIPQSALKEPGLKLPAVLCLHQTTPLGKAEPAGLGGNPNLHYAKELAQRGYVTLAPDYLGGDIPEVGLRGGFGEYRTDPYALGYVSGSMKGIWNHMRAVDFLQTLPFVDPGRIGVIGHSLGGYNSLFLAAFDTRIEVAVSSCGFTSFPKYRKGDLTGWSHRGHMPRIASVYGKDPAKMPFDFPDVLAVIAPRGVFINAPTGDDIFDVSGVKDCVAAAQPLYQKFRVLDRLVALYPETGHDFPQDVREAAYRFIDRMLGPPSQK